MEEYEKVSIFGRRNKKITQRENHPHQLATRTLNAILKQCKLGLTLNDLYDTTCMTHNRFSNFHCVCTIIQVVHTEFM